MTIPGDQLDDMFTGYRVPRNGEIIFDMHVLRLQKS